MKLNRLVLTGAAGRLGSYLREPLSKLADTLVSSDLVDDIGTRYPGEEYVRADLADLDAIVALLEGADMVVHFGAIGDEAPFDELLGPNFLGAYNVWEAAHRHGLRRVVYASARSTPWECTPTSGLHRHRRGLTGPTRSTALPSASPRIMASMYWDKRGIESVCMRIASCAQVNNARALGTWLSYDDLIQLVTRAIDTPTVRFTIVYGISNNDRAGLDNAGASHLGYRPKDNAEVFADTVLSETPPLDPADLGHMCHGGPFASVELGHSGTASMNVVDDRKSVDEGS